MDLPDLRIIFALRFMFDFHKDKGRYFDIQYKTSKEYVIPFLEQNNIAIEGQQVLEIGCAEAGVLKAFMERGSDCVGIELSEGRVELAREFFKDHPQSDKLELITENIYDINPETRFDSLFDIIILKDVIEHIHDHARFFKEVHSFLKPGGVIFFAFPPWQMPFGGHQQLAKSKLLSKWVYVHLLPRFMYRGIINMVGESAGIRDGLLEIAETGLSVEQFEGYSLASGFSILERKLWLTNPIYKYKFGLTVRAQLPVVKSLPYVRNFLTTCAYFLIQKPEE